MYNENNKPTNWAIATLDDITEIKNVLEYARGLVIKSVPTAESYETVTSTREGTKYVSAVLNLNSIDEMKREVIIANYKETNKYYLFLEKVYGIDYVTARTASDMKILKSLNGTLSVEDERLFLECYNETVTYYKNTFFTRAFDNQDYVREYYNLTIVSFAVQRYLTRKMKNYFDIDKYTKKQLKNAFISYGFDYFDVLPVNYQRRLLKILNELVSSKGTNHDIRKILDIFGGKNIDIYKYILAKLYPIKEDGEYDYDSPYLVFYKTLADGIIDYDKDVTLSYENVTEGDIYWKVDKEEVLYKRIYNTETEEYEIKSDRHFNTLTSKYMSVDITQDVLNDTLKMSYLFNFLYQFELYYKDKQNKDDFGFFNRELSSNKISIFTAIVGFIYLTLHSIGLDDNINFFPNQLNDIYGYKNLDSNEDVKELLKEIQILILQNKDKLEKENKFKDLYRFFKDFTLYDFDSTSRSSINTLYALAEENGNIKLQLNNISKYTNYIPLKYYLTDDNVDIMDKTEFLRKCIIDGRIEAKYITEYHPDYTSFFGKYIVIEGYKYPTIRIEMCSALELNEYLRKDIEAYILATGNTIVQTDYENGDLVKLCDDIVSYTTKHRSEIIKQHNLNTDVALQAFLYTDTKDVTYYKNLYAYMQLFYFPFKNENENVSSTFSVSQLMKLFNMNEEVRKQLLEFMSTTDNWQLYYRYIQLFSNKMITKQDTSLYKGYTHFSDYVKANNYEFYQWLTQRNKDIESGELNGKEKREYFRDKLFELAESIDSYLGATQFTNFPLSGVLDFIVYTIYLIATVFKSFTVDLIKSDTTFKVDDSIFNAIRLFDEVSNIEIGSKLKDRFDLVDVFRMWYTDKAEDKFVMYDEFTITEYEDENGTNGTVSPLE